MNIKYVRFTNYMHIKYRAPILFVNFILL